MYILKNNTIKNLSKFYSLQVCRLVLGSKVDKFSKILIKTSSAMEFIELNIKNTKVPKIDDPII